MNAVLRVVCLAVLSFLLLPSAAPVLAQEPVEAQIRALLDAQVKAWNRGDLDAFMQGYWHSPELTFSSPTVVSHGWQATLDRYRRRYQGTGQEMGHLSFDELSVHPLGADSAYATGRWHLHFASGKPDAGGRFTLVLRRFSDGWRIVHDHTS